MRTWLSILRELGLVSPVEPTLRFQRYRRQPSFRSPKLHPRPLAVISRRAREGLAVRRVAIFGNAGGGKSSLAKRLSLLTSLPLYHLDLIQFRPNGGGRVPDSELASAHSELLLSPEWIIDGFGSSALTWERCEAADTLIYLDLPLRVHRWRVIKRLLQAPFVSPEGWPRGSPIWRSTMDSYRVVAACETHLAPRYRKLVADAASHKEVHHLRSPDAVARFLWKVEDGQNSVRSEER